MEIRNLENKWIAAGHIRSTDTVPQPGGLLRRAAQAAEAAQLHDAPCALKAQSPRTAQPRWRERWGFPDGRATARRVEGALTCYSQFGGQGGGGVGSPRWRDTGGAAVRVAMAALKTVAELRQETTAEIRSCSTKVVRGEVIWWPNWRTPAWSHLSPEGGGNGDGSDEFGTGSGGRDPTRNGGGQEDIRVVWWRLRAPWSGRMEEHSSSCNQPTKLL
jgi:hypothetical protein